MTEIANPVGIENRLPTSYGQRVKRADRTARIVFEIVEIWCVVALVDSLQESEMDLHQIFEPVENARSEEHTSELQSRRDLVCRLLLEKKKLFQSDISLIQLTA